MHLQFCPWIPGLVSRGIFQLCRLVGFTAVGRKGGLTWLESICTPNKLCLSACLSGVPPCLGAHCSMPFDMGLWYMEFVKGEMLSFGLVAWRRCGTCSPGAAWLDPVLGHAKGPGVCPFRLARMKGWAWPIPEGSRNIHSVAANHLCAICLWNCSLHSG